LTAQIAFGTVGHQSQGRSPVMKKHILGLGVLPALVFLLTSLLPAYADTLYVTDPEAGLIYKYSTKRHRRRFCAQFVVLLPGHRL
jgi:hypothetical protein